MSTAKIVLGVTGGIACYKAVDLASQLTQSGYFVTTIMTDHAKEFVGPATFRGVTRNPVYDSLWADTSRPVPHISLGEDADVFIVAPATANVIGKIANGLADDLLTTTIMATPAKKIIVPSMNTNMWNNPIVQDNLKKLQELGFTIIEPDYGHLACGVVGKGRYPDNKLIIDTVTRLLAAKQTLVGKKVIITGGGTKEPIDPVRVISNLSSGKMAKALVAAAKQAGADVTYIEATTVEGLKKDVLKNFAQADVVIMAAAVSDYRPVTVNNQKIKKKNAKLTIELEKTEDILGLLGKKKTHQYLVGFALESEDLAANAKEKLINKNCDLIVGNSTEALGAENTCVTIISRETAELFQGPKSKVAEQIIDRICRGLRRA
jgi:phosphopantothenoylcysteine decarboxylase/phosphopantothenate--cysteine ligase